MSQYPIFISDLRRIGCFVDYETTEFPKSASFLTAHVLRMSECPNDYGTVKEGFSSHRL